MKTMYFFMSSHKRYLNHSESYLRMKLYMSNTLFVFIYSLVTRSFTQRKVTKVLGQVPFYRIEVESVPLIT